MAETTSAIIELLSTSASSDDSSSSSNDKLPFFSEINQDILGITMLISGLFICFFGAKFFKHIIFFFGFVLGGLGSYFLVPEFLGLFGFEISPQMLLYVSLAIGAALGILFVVIYKAAVFSCGAIAGVIVAQAIWQSIVMPLKLDDEIPYPDVFQVVGWVVFALLGGWLAFKLAEFVLKGVTSFIGAFMFASSVAYFISRAENGNKSETDDVMSWLQYFTTSSTYKDIDQTCNAYCWICMSLWLVLFCCGCYIQYKFHKKHQRKDYDDDVSDTEEGESDDELDERKQKREAIKAAKKARKGGTVQEVRDGSADMSGRVGSYSGGGRPSYYSSNNGYNGYNGYNANYNRGYNSGYNSSGQYYTGGASRGNVNYV